MADPIPAQKAPYRADLEPFCDGSHKGTGILPVVFKADETKEVWFCGCKATKGQPYCDGTHSTL